MNNRWTKEEESKLLKNIQSGKPMQKWLVGLIVVKMLLK